MSADSHETIVFAGAARQAQLVRANEISPTELVDAHLRRIERINPQLNAFRIVFAERALREARQAESALAAGDDRPLLGVPIALKDNHDLAGEHTTHGTDAFPEPAHADSAMVARVRQAGAIVVGKTLMPELAISGFTESATWGVSRNPWNPYRSPGGSSGGSAAAVAAGLVSVASASDGAGSIRLPAASCGIFGLKPQRGRVPMAPLFDHWRGLTVNGCLSRTVADTAAWLDITGGGPAEPGALGPPRRSFADAAETAPGRLRIAYSTATPPAVIPATVSAEVKNTVAEMVEVLGGLGHRVEQRDPAWGTIGTGSGLRYLRGIADDVASAPHPERLERRTRAIARIGGVLPNRLVAAARDGAAADAARINAIFADHDVLMTPVMGGTALPVRRWEGRGAFSTLLGMSRFYPYCLPWNHLGNPAMSVPAGMSVDGMPRAVQIIGRPGDEATLLSLAAQIEAERPWADHRPPG